MSEHGVALFHTTSSAFRAERILQDAGVRTKMIPVPREFSSDCGVAAQFPWMHVERVTALLGEYGVETAGIHELPEP